MTLRHTSRMLQLAAVILISAAVYIPGLKGPLLLDDYGFFARVPLLYMDRIDWPQIRDALLSSGKPMPHRALARLSFALNFYLAGGRFDAFQLKLTNLVIHLANGLLVFLLARIMVAGVSRPGGADANGSLLAHLPLGVAALWLLHPIQLLSVLYVSQRCTSLSATCVFLGLLLYAAGRRRLPARPARGLALMACGVAGGIALGFQFKENAVLLPLFALLLDLYFFPRDALDGALRRRLVLFHALVFATLAGVGVAILVHDPRFITAPYAGRSFTLGERLLTEPRVLLFYVRLLFWPFSRSFGLYQDDFGVSTGLLHPWSTLPAAAILLLLAAAALRSIGSRQVWSFGVLWFLAGHALESSFIALEIVFVHRNYVPSLGVMFAVVYYLAVWLPARVAWRKAARAGAVAALSLVLASNAWATLRRASVWQSREAMVRTGLAHHPRSSRAHAAYAWYVTDAGGDARNAFQQWQEAALLDPTDVESLIDMKDITAGALRTLKGGRNPRAGSPPVPTARSIWKAPLVADAAYLRDLDTRIGDEIAARLREEPVTATTEGALRLQASCLVRHLDQCAAGAVEVRDWLSLALANSRSTAGVRRQLKFSLAKVYRAEGDFREAIAWQKRALEGMGGLARIYWRIQLAALYLEAGDPRSGKAVLRSLLASADKSAKLGTLARRLRARLRRGTPPQAPRGAQ